MTIAADLEADIAARTNELSRTGFCIIPNALPAQTIGELDSDLEVAFSETPFGEGGFYGTTTIRFGRLLARSAHAASLVQHRLILGIVERILSPWCDCIQLNTTQAIAVHPGAPAQLPHRDQDMWRGPVGEIEYLVNVMWPLTQFTPENGATRVWPGSHGEAALLPSPEDAPVAAAMQPGDALIFLGSALHGAGSNLTQEVRRGIVIGYALGWLKPYENQWLAYPPDVARKFPPELAALVGYRQHRPNLGNYEGQCPSVLLAGEPERPRGAMDALRPDQKALVDAFVAGQLPAS
ncbi:phytanoyl-CoA dioxygenase family protein [Sandaracinobacteroides hominis]|uniref:phytanoyl-CoA dioxygenase family protein n=1 Tax=Sandaracinobacteroides hominis TaxID=2780086 RepID=UPI0018F29D2A|nr:phytanoyl-CoA dioxygenase family protein [Sandaracinobacteroides hominis]